MRFLRSLFLMIIMLILFLEQALAVQGENSSKAHDSAYEAPKIIAQIHLLVDGKEAEPENMPLLLSSGRAVITLQALQNLIPCQSEMGQDGELFILWEQSRIQILPGYSLILVNSIPRNLDFAPVKTADGSYLLPLRAFAEVLGYKVFYATGSQTIQLCSPGYTPLPQTAQINYNALPTWGSISSVPGLTDLWPGEPIVAGYFTKILSSSAARTNNIMLSAAKVNGKILQNDEVFSFNQTVGPRTAQGGYQIAKVFSGKKVINGIGGGVCQTSTTLYNTALEAGFPVMERHPHSLHVAYAPLNRDATVSWGGADFKFRNTSGCPLKLLCKVENGYVFVVFVKAVQPSKELIISPTLEAINRSSESHI